MPLTLSSRPKEDCKFLSAFDICSVRPHIEDDGIGAWNINLSKIPEQYAEWWIVSNTEENKRKVGGCLNGIRRRRRRRRRWFRDVADRLILAV